MITPTAKRETAVTGIVLRQKLGQPPAGPPQYSASPDLLLIGAADAFDPTVFTDPTGYDWYFFQAPVIGEPNYLYVRGINNNPAGIQKARIYLYFAQSDQILDPTKWQSTGFTVNGNAQSYQDVSAVAQWQYVATTTPFSWTPPTPSTSGASYYLIAWVDNSASPSPPTWPTTPFASMDALGAYIQQHGNMVMLDTLYRGGFVRQFPGQTIAAEGTGAQTSPDIIAFGAAAAQDVSALANQSDYDSGKLRQTLVIGQPNFLYLRALNTASGAGAARVYLFWATTGQISPTGFSGAGFTVAGVPQNWVDLTATAGGQVMVSTVPIVWNPPPPPTGQSYVLITYADASASPQPPDFAPFGYINPAGATQLLATHPQMSWLSTTASSPARPTASDVASITTPAAAHSYYVGVQLTNIPTDGELSVSIPGPDGANTVVATSMSIPASGALIAWPVQYPASFQTSVVWSYWQGATAPSGSFGISVKLLITG
ncbi:hypothetical protein BE20_39910 [Sorangium cellulosum]|uniref:Uncharacterized protein n=1 Tax=Sorangium cellulosum TaxID=56 RepID=A0A150RAB8_SORCE|nr:hypothetical protein BE18_52170 [Sorangium cellulosum]KYF97097.1 hypothetical protein BE20_39910 [Sorangium cellulosum]